ncbi:cellulose binding domain-containing protein [Algivirga pacifica]|uniref:CBM3 domain-containing protein n=1 Tax=Algivirga pacifica TaxID=1162670 RepID=A0ABP9D2A5_9BACT
MNNLKMISKLWSKNLWLGQWFALTTLLFVGALKGYAGTIYNCNTVAEIRTAMSNAGPGDEIVIASGVYEASGVAVSGSSAYFYANANGTAANPIIIRSASSSSPATLKGSNISSLTVLRIEGDHWIVKDLKITNGQKGLIFDNSNYSQAINCEVYNIGYEAIHVRDGSDYVTIDGCNVHDTGKSNAGFGEGIYIGTDKGSWSNYDPYVNYTTVKNSIIGPNVAAEAFDIKEGTSETVVEHCQIDAAGLSGSNYADSFIDLKGVRTYIRCNTFYRNNESNLTKGIAAIDRGVALSSDEHAIYNNTFYMNGASNNIVEAYSGTNDVYAWDNSRVPSGDLYSSRIVDQCCPSWFTPTSSCGVAPTQYTLSITATNGSVSKSPNKATYSDGEQVTLTATPNTGYQFDGWSGAVSGTNNTVTLTMNSNKAVVANFSQDTSGSGGGGGTPPSSDITLEYEEGDGNPGSNSMRPYINLVNNGSSAIPYSELTVRYWFTVDGAGSPVFNVDYAPMGKSNVNGSFSAVSGGSTADYYMEVSFTAGAGSLAAGGESGRIKLRATKSNWANYDETNDYSYDASKTSLTPHSLITVYRNGTLVWGTEPSANSRMATVSTEVLTVYPNPSRGKILLRGISAGEEVTLELFDFTGKKVQEVKAISQIATLEVDLTSHSKGMYLLGVQQAGKRTVFKIFKE